MFLLRFTVENHRSFRAENDLLFVQRRLKTSRPQDGPWVDYTNSVAAIYGANASGKSGLLGALQHVHSLMLPQKAESQRRPRLPYSPFALDDTSRGQPSRYVLDFVMNDTRYEYGIAHTDKQVTQEWLYEFPKGRQRVLFERGDAVEDGLTFGRALKGGETTLKRIVGTVDLVLTKGADLRNEQLSEIHHALSTHITIANFGEADRTERLRAVVEDVADGTLAMEDLQIMLKVADVGIAGAAVTEEEPPPELRRIVRAILRAGRSEVDHLHEEVPENAAADTAFLVNDVSVGDVDETQLEKILAQTARFLMFQHVGDGDRTYQLPTHDQSTGTLTWLSLAAPALRMIRLGGVLAVDELDASLHPQLAQVMIELFRDKRINTKGAQLLFTTHDTFFMSPTSEIKLKAEEVWFVEKGRNGASELFSLADFPHRDDHNYSRRYLQGRYGAVPAVAPAFLEALADRPIASDVAEGDSLVIPIQ